ncbi:MAG TPA: glycoside hydrolase family 15 protein [Balneolales bacterium]|nr:glycoside hydrolase family 15 protein [Balneolales bacterium]
MSELRGDNKAFGHPGLEPKWTHGNKDGVGTAYSADSRLWFTIWNGAVTETYYPTIDRPQIRDLQFLISDGNTFFYEEKKHLQTKTERISDNALGYRITNTDPDGRFSIQKDIITAPHLSCLLQHTKLKINKKLDHPLSLYVLCAPHLQVGGMGNNGYVMEVAGREILVAEKDGMWLALMASEPFKKLSVGYVAKSDGWTDLNDNYKMDWEFDHATNGNIALTGQLSLEDTQEFTLGMAFGDGMHNAITTLFQAMGIPFKQHFKRYTDQWKRPTDEMLPLEKVSGDGGHLYRGSYSLLLSHEDKTFPGALIASMSIPWGEVMGDDDMGGYHLVWTRDMVNSATGLLAAGNKGTALRAMIYLAATQHDDGGFSQNFWINGDPYWRGIQLDEVAFPIMLAWRLQQEKALQDFDPFPMVMRAARFLIKHGPATGQERWEEASGYSPSTLASNITALVCAGAMARKRGEKRTAAYLEEYADFLSDHIESWTVTTKGSLAEGISRHYIRINPVNINDPHPDEDPNLGYLTIANRAPGEQYRFPARDVVDAGFLELVRYGIRSADDPVIVDSIKVIDKVLKEETPYGPCWRRYNHDGYGQHEDGSAFKGWGQGRAWPLLTGERAHYELAAGHDIKPLIKAIEQFSSTTGMLPEQVWDRDDRPDVFMFKGRPTGSAMPLMWAHAEYIKLLRSMQDGQVFDRFSIVENRYLKSKKKRAQYEIWKPNRQVDKIKPGMTLRVQSYRPFALVWTDDEWDHTQEVHSEPTALGIEYLDVEIKETQKAPIRFTFHWMDNHTWEGKNYEVMIDRK